ncbi:MAG: tetratricopeptide repeat protein [Anaerolineae bacterium]|nr:tetratricopeptide repeat protein [Anaerolineae bacterium]
MKCGQCGFENPTGFTFCGRCGASLDADCPHCGFKNPPGFLFCGQCGASLEAKLDRLSETDLEHLQAYLPPSLMKSLQFDPFSPPPTLLSQCLAHFSVLLQTTYTHLPIYLIEWILRDPTPGQVGGQFFDGTLLFADISGFTAMSERLSRVGREGAEEINLIVNRYFSTMLSILREHHGQMIAFGGDALLGLFIEPDSAARAVQAAWRMQTAMGAFTQTATSQGIFSVQMKVGVHRGRFFAAHLGTTQGMEYALFGRDVNATAATESAANGGQILLDAPTLAAISVPCRTTAVPGTNYLTVEEIEPAAMLPYFELPAVPALADPTMKNLRRAVELLDAFTPYLPTGLLTRLVSDPQALGVQGEHRLVAALFANVVGLGEIADRLGPGREDEIVTGLNRYFVTVSQAIHHFGGVVNSIDLNTRGDKIFAAFGAPMAHEDDPERAVRAAMAMQDAMAEMCCALPEEVGLPDLCLEQKIGVSVGYVFAGYVGTNWRHDYTVMGDDVNLAARLMSKADPGNVIVSGDVRRKVQAIFELVPRGKVPLKGKSQPVPLFSLSGLREVPEPVRGLKGMFSELVGRQAEWTEIQTALEQLLSGRGQIVSVIGEAGLGKSRIVADARRAHPSLRWVEGRCLSYTEASSYWAFHEIVRRIVGIRPGDSEREAWAKLRNALGRLLPRESMDTHLPYLGSFLGLSVVEEELYERVCYLSAEALQRRIFVALAALLEAHAHAEPTPLVLLLEDIHWLDRASIALLAHVMPLVNRVPLMFLLAYRPERTKEFWQIQERARREFAHCTTEVILGPLSPADSYQLLVNLSGIVDWPAPMRERILDRAEGIPLYLEEVLRVLVEDRILVKEDDGWRIGEEMETITVPDTLQGVLMARLDRLEESSRWTAQLASVVGRAFPFDILSHFQPENQDQLLHHLVSLQQLEIVRETARIPELVYAFKQGLMQEVCYRSLLTRTRRQYHRKIAEYLETRHAISQLEAESSDALIAHHATAGQDWPRALCYHLSAGQQAQQLYANHAAIAHFETALASAANLSSDETASQRLVLHGAMGELLTTTGRYEHAQGHLEQTLTLSDALSDRKAQARACRWLGRMHELQGAYTPALEWIERGLGVLGEQETAETVQLLINAALIHTRQGAGDRAMECVQDALRIARDLGDLTALARANNMRGHFDRLKGDSASAIDHFQQAHDLYRRAGDIHGQAVSLNQIANAHFDVGQWREADQHYRQARAIFEQMGDVYNRAIADNNLGGIALNQGRLDEALGFYSAAVNAVEQIGESLWIQGVFHMNLGATYARRSEADVAMQHLRTALNLFEQAQSRDFVPETWRHLASSLLLSGEQEQARAYAGQALDLGRELSMRGEEGKVLRVLGEVAMAGQDWEKATAALEESVTILGEVQDEYEQARSRLVQAQLFAAQGEREHALTALDACRPVFERLEAQLDLAAARTLQTSTLKTG